MFQATHENMYRMQQENSCKICWSFRFLHELFTFYSILCFNTQTCVKSIFYHNLRSFILLHFFYLLPKTCCKVYLVIAEKEHSTIVHQFPGLSMFSLWHIPVGRQEYYHCTYLKIISAPSCDLSTDIVCGRPYNI